MIDLANGFVCCHLDCDRTASWLIAWGPWSDDYTHACDEHREELTPTLPEGVPLFLTSISP